MANLKYAKLKGTFLHLAAAILLYATTAVAQSATDSCKPAAVIPLTASESPATIIIDPPLAGPLASRGVVIIRYCAQNLHIAPVFGANAVAVLPLVGHVHVSVDNAPWVWAGASGNPVILQHLSPGPHKVVIELNDANHYPLDKGTVTFVVPEKSKSEEHHESGQVDEEAAPIYGVTIPPGYRDLKLVYVTHEEGDFDQLRAQLGNDIAIKAYREGKLPFPDGAIIVALHWKRVPSEEDNKVFGRVQAFIAGSPVNLQVMVKDSKKYAATGGWGFGDFRNGKPSDAALHEKCFTCHIPAKASDYVFTRYAP